MRTKERRAREFGAVRSAVFESLPTAALLAVFMSIVLRSPVGALLAASAFLAILALFSLIVLWPGWPTPHDKGRSNEPEHKEKSQ